MSLSEREFEALLRAGMDELNLKTQAHQSGWRLGQEESWQFDQESGELVFTFPDVVVSAPAQIIGSYDKPEGAWMWAWANVSIADALKADSQQVRDFGEQHGIERLTRPKWPGTRTDCWFMTALAFYLCGCEGAYRGPAGGTFVYLTFRSLRFSKPQH